MFQIKKNSKFFKSILSTNRERDINFIISSAKLTDLYATLMVIREVLMGKIPIKPEEFEKLKRKNKLFKLARYTL